MALPGSGRDSAAASGGVLCVPGWTQHCRVGKLVKTQISTE